MNRIFLVVISMVFVTFSKSQTWVPMDNGVGNSVGSHTELNNELYITVRSGSVYSNTRIDKWDEYQGQWTNIWYGYGQTKYYFYGSLTSYNNELYCIYGYTDTTNTSKHKYFVLRFNGTDFDTIGKLPTSSFSCGGQLTVYNDKLYFSSSFDSINNIAAKNIAAWDGVSWTALGSGLTNPPNHILECNGWLYATGTFTLIGDSSTRHIIRWNDAAWDTLGNCMNSNDIKGLYYMESDNDILYIRGNINGNDSIVEWDGATCRYIGYPKVNWYESYLICALNNHLYSIRDLSRGQRISEWDGYNWSTIYVNNSIVDTLFTMDLFPFQNELYITGELYCFGFSEQGILKLMYPALNTEEYNNSDMVIYPNPVHDKLYVETSEVNSNTCVIICDLKGCIMYEKTLREPFEKLDLDDLSSGVYTLQLIGIKFKSVIRIVKD